MFERVIPDAEVGGNAKRVLLSSGRVYYDLLKKREELEREDVALIRVEQLYPFPVDELKAALKPYKKGTPVVWVQDEPQNMGAWRYLRVEFGFELFEKHPFSGVTRPASASPATGSANCHKREQAKLLDRAFE